MHNILQFCQHILFRDVLRKKYLKLLNGIDDLPICLTPSEEEVELLRNQVSDLVHEEEFWQKKTEKKRETLYVGAAERQFPLSVESVISDSNIELQKDSISSDIDKENRLMDSRTISVCISTSSKNVFSENADINSLPNLENSLVNSADKVSTVSLNFMCVYQYLYR